MANSMLEKIRNDRLEKIRKLREMGIDPYPTTSGRTHKSAEIMDNFEKMQGKEVTVAGRVMFWRDFGKLTFAKLRDGSGQIQLLLKKQNLGKDWAQLKLYDVGDIVDATGTVTKTKTGEISVEVTKLTILTKALRPLPEKREGLKDIESRYRRRYLDFLLNEEARRKILNRAEIEKAIREFLWSKDFVEVDTPILQPTYGGTNAKPFVTHINALNMDMYLSVAHELYLKRVIVAGIENVFTIGRCFRNEGIDKSHNPEFSLLETMSAYHNYEFNMDITEEMYRYICDHVFGRFDFKVVGQDVDLEKPWKRVMMVDLVREEKGLDFEKMSLDDANNELAKVKIEPQNSVGVAMVEYMESQIAPNLIQPTFVMGHPVEVSPLCKRIPGNEKYVERFELYFGGMETGDNWTELNDPVELRQRFEDEQKKKEEGDEEAHPMDLEFVEAMEFGMAPTTGLGPGIERLAMMLGETENIDDVIWFPMMKRKGGSESGGSVAVTDKLDFDFDQVFSDHGIRTQSITIPEIEGDKYLSMSDDFRKTYPTATSGYVIIEGVKVEDRNADLVKLRKDILSHLRGLTSADIDSNRNLRSFREMYRTMGIDWHSRRPSPEALLRRVSQGRELYNVNTMVDAYNLVVITQQVSVGTFDLDNLETPLTLEIAKGGEKMEIIGGDIKEVAKGEVIYMDKKEPYNLDYNYRDAERSKTALETTRILINAEGVGEISAEQVLKALKLTAAIVLKYGGGKVVGSGLVRAGTV